jgi:SPFH domain / Band 7 family
MKSSLKKLIIIGSSLIVFFIWLIASFRSINTDPGFESVIIDKPYIFGSNQIRKMPLTSGRQYVWFSTDVVKIETRPVQHEEKFDDMTTSDNIYVDFNAYIRTSIKSGGSPYLLEHFGLDYFRNNIQQTFRTYVRDQVSLYDMTSLTTRSEAISKAQKSVMDKMLEYIALKKLPVIIEEINFGKILPNENVLAELNRTAEQQQRVQTENNKASAETARKSAETKRAEADNAYKNSLGLSSEQYIALKQFEAMVDASKNGANVFFNSPGIVSQRK